MDLKFCSSKQILNKVLRDFKIAGSGFDLDAIEWITEGLELIGTLQIYQRFEKEVTVTDNILPIFCGLEKLIDITVDNSCVCWKNFNPCCSNYNYPIDPNRTAVIDIPNIRFNFTDTPVTIHYYGFSYDEDGYPMIIDNPQVREALTWFIIFHLLLSGCVHPNLTIKDANEFWIDYKVKASNSLNMPYASTLGYSADRFRSPNSYQFSE